MKKTGLVFATTALAVLLASGVAWAAAGDFDRTFSNNGQVVTNLTPSDDQISDVAVLPSGKIVAAGTSGANNDGVVLRYLPDGTLDPTFGGGDGIAKIGDSIAYAVLPQSEGKLLVAGARYVAEGESWFDIALVRLDADGSLDESFGGGDGKVTTGLGPRADDYAYGLSMQQGKIVVAGFSSLPKDTGREDDIALVRYLADGTLDKSFGSGGIVESDLRGDDTAEDLAVQRDGRIVVTGSSHAGDSRTTRSDLAVVRYRPGGLRDETFGGGDGTVLTDFGDEDYGAGLVLRGGGRPVVAGWTNPQSEIADYAFALAAYDSDGSLDETFGGGDGKVTTRFYYYSEFHERYFSEDSLAYDLARQADGKLVAFGTADNFALARYLPSGELDTSFGGGDGKVDKLVGRCSGCVDIGTSMDVQADGRIVGGGYIGHSMALARYQGD